MIPFTYFVNLCDTNGVLINFIFIYLKGIYHILILLVVDLKIYNICYQKTFKTERCSKLTSLSMEIINKNNNKNKNKNKPTSSRIK